MVDQAIKQSDGKRRTRLLYEQFNGELDRVLQVLEFGAKKYPAPPLDDSWRNVPPEYYREAIQRHMNAVYRGEFLDIESGLPHYAHMICDALFLMHLEGSIDEAMRWANEDFERGEVK